LYPVWLLDNRGVPLKDIRDRFVRIKMSTAIRVVLLIVALALAVTGWSKAGDFGVPPIAVALYSAAAAVIFVIIGVMSVRRKERMQRILGVAAFVAAGYLIFMAFVFYNILRSTPVLEP
jgi:predicted tellurium resistance membrane protein TerC